MKHPFICFFVAFFTSSGLSAQPIFSVDAGLPYFSKQFGREEISREAIGFGAGFPIHRNGEVRATARYNVFFTQPSESFYDDQQWNTAGTTQRVGNLLINYTRYTKEDNNQVALYGFVGGGLSYHMVQSLRLRDPNNVKRLLILKNNSDALLPGIHGGAGVLLNRSPKRDYFFQVQFGKYFAAPVKDQFYTKPPKGSQVFYSNTSVWHYAAGYWNFAFGLRFKRSK